MRAKEPAAEVWGGGGQREEWDWTASRALILQPCIWQMQSKLLSLLKAGWQKT